MTVVIRSSRISRNLGSDSASKTGLHLHLHTFHRDFLIPISFLFLCEYENGYERHANLDAEWNKSYINLDTRIQNLDERSANLDKGSEKLKERRDEENERRTLVSYSRLKRERSRIK